MRRVAAARPTGGSPRRWAGALLFALGGLFLLGIAAAPAASAHAILKQSVPSDGAVLTTAPDAVELHFDESVQVAYGAVRVFAADGSRVDSGTVHHPGGDAARIVVPVSVTGTGTYLVDWRVVSADTHPVHGSFTFSVGTPGTVADVGSVGGSFAIAVLLAMARFVVLASVAVVVGGVVLLLVCWPRGWERPAARRLVETATGVALAASVAQLLLTAGSWAGRGPGALLDPGVLQGLTGTVLATAVTARVLLLLAVAAALRLRTGTTRAGSAPGPAATGLLAVLLAGILLTIAATGHSAAGPHLPLLLLVDVSHLAAFSAWLGGLPLLAGVLLRGPHDDTAVRAVARFSRLAAGCVLLLVGSGLVQAWRQVGELAAVPTTTYGRLLLAKVALFGAALAAAAVSRQWVRTRATDPQRPHRPHRPMNSRGGSPTTLTRPLTAGVLRRSVLAELCLGTAVVAVTAVLIAQPPARVAYRPTMASTLQAGTVTVQLSAIPEGTRRLGLHVYTFDSSGVPLAVLELKVTALLPAQALGPLDLHVLPAGPGHFLAEGVTLPLAGDWQLSFYLRTSAIDSQTASTTLVVR